MKEVAPKLKTSNVTKCNFQFGTLKVVKSKRKVMPTKLTIKEKYIAFFNTRAMEHDFISGSPEVKSQIMYNFIYVDNIEFKESTSLSMTYNKDFRDQFKELKI
jgi:hypothetical protein